MDKAYKNFISQRCIEIISENEAITALYSDITKALHEIKRTFSKKEFDLFCEFESKINNIRTEENRYIYEQARKDNL